MHCPGSVCLRWASMVDLADSVLAVKSRILFIAGLNLYLFLSAAKNLSACDINQSKVIGSILHLLLVRQKNEQQEQQQGS